MGRGTPAQLKQVRTLKRAADRLYEEANDKREEAAEARKMADLSDPGQQRKMWRDDAKKLEREANDLSNQADKTNAKLYRLEEEIDPNIAQLHKRQDELTEASSETSDPAEKEALEKEWWKVTEKVMKERDALEARAAGSQSMNDGIQGEFDDEDHGMASADASPAEVDASDLGLEDLDESAPADDDQRVSGFLDDVEGPTIDEPELTAANPDDLEVYEEVPSQTWEPELEPMPEQSDPGLGSGEPDPESVSFEDEPATT